MALPTPTFDSVDLSETPLWTRSGSPTFVSDPFDPDLTRAMEGDGVDNMLSKAAELTVGAVHSASIWVDVPADGSGIFMAQFAANPVDFGTFFLGLSVGKIIARWDGTSESNRVLSIGNTDIRGAGLKLITTVVPSPFVCVIYIDDAEDTYSAQNASAGAGFVSTSNSGIPLTIGNFDTSGASDDYLKGDVVGAKLWEGTALVLADVQELFANGLPTSTGSDAVRRSPMSRINRLRLGF